MDWYIKKFEELTANELYALLRERVNVFVVEQNCPYPEVDDKDQASYHLYAKKNGEVVAYTRLLPAGVSYEQASIGRVLVKESCRKTGLGRELMERSMDFLKNHLKEKEVKLQAQEYAMHFYGSFGFKPVSEVYLEDDIPHVDMVWKDVSH
ncbi:GNAT family N-acetyltransferase [Salipaludibacillus sp. CUR1]|uniref:GNAT family N-acetyltransferase n=1 Tax=Salipaludibacillus sp. CUR1 TaxID=2820003 RepID=UPI001E3CDE8B|nr:GNAT family N-acetyltransferase [Salipaludibacillus sp. CUR1]MCE7791589.1 GNAT family N-acetyltransferase [Salipaludibacillus sp. CUR1]